LHIAGILALGILLENRGHTVASSLGLYIAALCLAGIGGGLIGALVGHLCASAWEAVDLRLHPRRFEEREGGA